MSGSKILVVEDHPASLRMLEKMLRKNYVVIPASSGLEAIAKAEDENPDLVLLDIEMPGMDGFQTFEVLKNKIIAQAVPVIFLTAREDSESREKGLEAGAVDYITKPYDSQELAIKVKNHLALYEARKEIEARNRVMAREMEMASQLQNSLLPQDFPAHEGVSFSVVYRPVSEAGGDFYDVIELPDNRIGFAVVDVSGHGVSAAMIGAMFKMAFQSFARVTPSPSQLLAKLNEELYSILPDSDFLTVFYGIIDTQSLELTFTNAGHPEPFLYRGNSGVIEQLTLGGPLLGAFSSMDYEEAVTKMHLGDKILIFTDGVTEASKTGKTDDFFGEERLNRAFLEGCNSQDSELLSHIMNTLEQFRGVPTFDDDITILLTSIT